jgi:hypothetical protein
LSIRDCGKIYGTKRLETASAILNGLVLRGILKVEEKGLSGKRRATRFRYIYEKDKLVALSNELPTKTKEAATTSSQNSETTPRSLNTPEMILRQYELERVENRMKHISDNYDSHQSWDRDDSREYKRLKGRRTELMHLLEFSA